MALKQYYIGSHGPYFYDDTSDPGVSEDQVATKKDVGDVVDLKLEGLAALASLEAIATDGIVTRVADDTFASREIKGTANQITVANGKGKAGDPTLSFPSGVTFPGSISTTQLEIRQSAIAIGLNKVPSHRLAIQVNGVTYFLLLQSS